MPLESPRWPRLLLCGLVLGWSGCAGTIPSGPNKRYAVSVARTEFYKYGPAQAYGPDASLPKGQKVTMVSRQFGYSQVRLEDGTPGYVATEDLVQLPPEPKPAVVATRGRSRFVPEPERKLDLTDVPLPLP